MAGKSTGVTGDRDLRIFMSLFAPRKTRDGPDVLGRDSPRAFSPCKMLLLSLAAYFFSSDMTELGQRGYSLRYLQAIAQPVLREVQYTTMHGPGAHFK